MHWFWLADFHSGTASTDGQVNPKRGKKVSINGQELAVFLYNGLVYAVLEKCPHMGKGVGQSVSLRYSGAFVFAPS